MKKRLSALGLSAVLLAFTPCTAYASFPTQNEIANVASTDQTRYTYVQSTVISVDPSSSGVYYSVAIFGNSQVTSISGTIKIYKGTTEIYSTPVSSLNRRLIVSDTIPTQGSGTYNVKFSGTVYATNGSEPIEIEHTDSY